MAPKVRRVAVIGAGPSGAIVTDALVKEQAFDTIRIFDRRAGVGGTWWEAHSSGRLLMDAKSFIEGIILLSSRLVSRLSRMSLQERLMSLYRFLESCQASHPSLGRSMVTKSDSRIPQSMRICTAT
jgi:cation diffusion facilitator CzcD-associated flavoprotein CzcO